MWRRQVLALLRAGAESCRDGYTVNYARVPRLFADLELRHGDGRFARLFRILVKADLLVLDDGRPDCLSANQRRDLMEIAEDRHGHGSILITSPLPTDKWHKVIGGAFSGSTRDHAMHGARRAICTSRSGSPRIPRRRALAVEGPRKSKERRLASEVDDPIVIPAATGRFDVHPGRR